MQEELSKYISHARQTGVPDEKIREQLTSAGWNATDIESAMREVGREKSVFKVSNTALLLVVGAIVLVLVGVGGYLVFSRNSQKPVGGIPETNQPINQSQPTSPARLAYRAGGHTPCEESIEIAAGMPPTSSRLLDNCSAGAGFVVVGWVNEDTLLVRKYGVRDDIILYELSTATKVATPLGVPDVRVSGEAFSFPTTSHFIAQAIKREPSLVAELERWRLPMLSDYRFFDGIVLFVAFNIESSSPSYVVYSFDRSRKQLSQKFSAPLTDVLDVKILNERKIVLKRLGRPDRKYKFFTANLDGSGQEELPGTFVTEALTDQWFVREGSIVYLAIEGGSGFPRQYRIGVFDIEKATVRETQLRDIRPVDDPQRNNPTTLALRDFSETGLVAYEVAGLGSGDCTLYVLDTATGTNTLVADKCFINDVVWSK